MRIEVLGDECGKCRVLYDNVRQAVAASGRTAEIVRTNDPETLARYGVLALPGLAVDGKLESSGKFLSVEELRKILDRAG
jgi:small redox-active disulfide protein 2